MKMMSDLSQKMDEGFATQQRKFEELYQRVDKIQEAQEAMFDELQVTRTHVGNLTDRAPPPS